MMKSSVRVCAAWALGNNKAHKSRGQHTNMENDGRGSIECSGKEKTSTQSVSRVLIRDHDVEACTLANGTSLSNLLQEASILNPKS